jgi:hypothetical protein
MADPKTPAPAQAEEPTEEQIWNELEAAEAGEKKPDADEFAEKDEKDDDAPADGGAAPAQVPPAQQQKQAPDIWESAPPDLKAAHDSQVKALETATTEHARRSIEGRISAYTRRLKERNEAAAQRPPAAEEAADNLAELAADILRSLCRSRRIARVEERFHGSKPSRKAAKRPPISRWTQNSRPTRHAEEKIRVGMAI